MTLDDLSHSGFRAFAASLDPALEPDSARSFSLYLEEDRLPLRLSLHPDDVRLVVQIFVADVSAVLGPARASMLAMLAAINRSALAAALGYVALDERDFVSLTCHWPLHEHAGDAFTDALAPWQVQAVRLREMISALSLQDPELDYTLAPTPAETAEAPALSL